MNTSQNKKAKFVRPLVRPTAVVLGNAGTPCRPSGEL